MLCQARMLSLAASSIDPMYSPGMISLSWGDLGEDETDGDGEDTGDRELEAVSVSLSSSPGSACCLRCSFFWKSRSRPWNPMLIDTIGRCCLTCVMAASN